MSRTRHFEARMSQRGITRDIVELVLEYGEVEQDKRVLGRRELVQLIDHLDDLKRTALRAMDKGGIVVVEAEGRLVTAYSKRTFNRSKVRIVSEIAA